MAGSSSGSPQNPTKRLAKGHPHVDAAAPAAAAAALVPQHVRRGYQRAEPSDEYMQMWVDLRKKRAELARLFAKDAERIDFERECKARKQEEAVPAVPVTDAAAAAPVPRPPATALFHARCQAARAVDEQRRLIDQQARKTEDIHRLLLCTKCDTVWNRDFNACLNIMEIARSILARNKKTYGLSAGFFYCGTRAAQRPGYLCRGSRENGGDAGAP
jgi:hypothetical protein